ncbi:MAG: hypothetical protein WBL31_13250 [Ilumatobacteraceae bacterium]
MGGLPGAPVIATTEHSDHHITSDRNLPTAKATKLTVSIKQI